MTRPSSLLRRAKNCYHLLARLLSCFKFKKGGGVTTVVHIPLIYATSCQPKPIKIIGCVCNEIAVGSWNKSSLNHIAGISCWPVESWLSLFGISLWITYAAAKAESRGHVPWVGHIQTQVSYIRIKFWAFQNTTILIPTKYFLHRFTKINLAFTCAAARAFLDNH